MQSEPIFLSGSLAVWNFRGRVANFCLPAQPEPRGARRGNSIRTILRIHRQLGFCKWTMEASQRQNRRSASISNGFLAKNEMHLSNKIWFEPICFQILWQFGIFAAESLIFACPPLPRSARQHQRKVLFTIFFLRATHFFF